MPSISKTSPWAAEPRTGCTNWVTTLSPLQEAMLGMLLASLSELGKETLPHHPPQAQSRVPECGHLISQGPRQPVFGSPHIIVDPVPAPVPCQATSGARCRQCPWTCLPALLSHPCTCQAHMHMECGTSWEPLHLAKGAFLIFMRMKTFPKSKCLGGFEEFPPEMK